MDPKDYLENINLDLFKNILSYNLNITSEKVLILGDTGWSGNVVSPVLSKAFKAAADELGMNAELVLQHAKISGDSADEELVDKMYNLPENSVIIMNMSEKLGKLGPIGLSFRKFCKQRGHRFTSASSLGVIQNDQINHILDAYDIDYKAISKKAHKIKKMFDNASELHITSKAGTDILYNIENMKAVVSDGIYRNPGEGGNVPGSETYVPPFKDKVEGKIVIDGSMRSKEGTRLIHTPIEMTIKNGAIESMNNCEEARILENTLRWAHDRAKHPWGIRRIGEFGFGLNPKAEIIGCTVVDEKKLGTGHFAIGSNYWFGGSIYAIIHLDQVFKNMKCKADGKTVNP